MNRVADALLQQAEGHEVLARGLRAEAAALAQDAARVPDAAPYLTIQAYADRLSISKRTCRSLLDEGMPSVGSGRGRRIDVQRADDWMRTRRDRVDDAVEVQARREARAAALATSTTTKRNGGLPGKVAAVSEDENANRT